MFVVGVTIILMNRLLIHIDKRKDRNPYNTIYTTGCQIFPFRFFTLY